MLAWMSGKRLTFTLLVELKIGAATLESSMAISQKTWKGPTIWLSYPTPCLYPEDLQLAYYSNTTTSMFIAAHFTIARLWNQPRCPLTDEWIKKLWYMYTMGYYSAIKKNNIMAFANKWMELENIMLSKINQTPKTKGRMFSLIGGKWYIMGVGSERRMEEL